MKYRLYKTMIAICAMPVMIGGAIVMLAYSIALPVIAFIYPDKVKIK